MTKKQEQAVRAARASAAILCIRVFRGFMGVLSFFYCILRLQYNISRCKA